MGIYDGKDVTSASRRSPWGSFGLLCVAVAAAALVSCGGPPRTARSLAPVAALPKPSLPPWIASISPAGTAAIARADPHHLRQAGHAGRRRSPAPARTTCSSHVSHRAARLRGHFTVLTPRMIGFVADQALPIGTRVRVTLPPACAISTATRWRSDLSWTLRNRRRSPSRPSADAGRATTKRRRRPSACGRSFKSPRTPRSTQPRWPRTRRCRRRRQRARQRDARGARRRPIPGTDARRALRSVADTWVYDLRPARDLRTRYGVHAEIAPGVEPAYGNVATTTAIQRRIHTYGALAIVPTPSASPDSGGRFADGDPGDRVQQSARCQDRSPAR